MNLNSMLDELTKLSRISLFTLIPLTAAFIVTSYLSNSLTILSLALDSGVSIVVQAFAFNTIRAMKSADSIRFPHGTGKLENFSGFLYGALNIPVALYIIFHSIADLPAPAPTAFTIAQLPMIPSLIRSVYLYWFATRLSRQFESPLIESYVVDFRVAVGFDSIVILAMAAGMISNMAGIDGFAHYIDPVFSLCIGLYMLRAAVLLLMNNFKILIDLPMPENEQLEIIRVLASEFDSYEQIGTIRTRRSGSQRFVEIELYFLSTADVTAIASLSSRIREKLREKFSDLKLGILVLEYETAEESSQAA